MWTENIVFRCRSVSWFINQRSVKSLLIFMLHRTRPVMEDQQDTSMFTSTQYREYGLRDRDRDLLLYELCSRLCLEGEGELLCRPYCLSHSSLSFSRLSRSFIRILRAMARSSPSRSCRLCSCCWIFTCAAFLSALDCLLSAFCIRNFRRSCGVILACW